MKGLHSSFLWTGLAFSLVAVPAAYLAKSILHPAAPSLKPSAAVPPVHGVIPDFTLVDQASRPFAGSSLRGKVWITNFIFTSCAGACPRMTARMAGLQKEIPPEIHLVSMTVDPARDTPPVLALYAAQHNADPARWHFLTGPAAVLHPLIQRGFRLSVAEGGGPEEPILHSQRFVLVDRAGQIRGYYDSTDPQAMERLVHDADSLSRSP